MEFKALKKAAAVILCAAVAGLSVVTAFAAGNTYSVPEASDMQITLPDDMTAVTRSSDANDKYFSLFGIDYNTNKQTFESSNIYLQGMNSSSSLTVTVTVTETDESKQITNYNMLESDRLSEIARNFLSQTEYTSCTVDQAVNSIVWLDFNTRVNYSGSLIQAYQANTVYGGKSVNITLQRNGGNVTAEDYETFSNIVSSVEFNKIGFLSSPLLPYILIGAGVLLILIVIFVIIIVRVASRRRKKSKNDKILEELAGKYTTNKPANNSNSYDLNTFDESASAPASDKTQVYNAAQVASRAEAPAYTEPKSEGRRYSDAEIDAMLGDTEDEPSNFTQALPQNAEEEPEEAKDVTIDENDPVSEFFEDEPDEAVDTAEEASFEVVPVEVVAAPETPDEITEEPAEEPAPEEAEVIEEETEAEEPAEDETETGEEAPAEETAEPSTKKFDFPVKPAKRAEEPEQSEADTDSDEDDDNDEPVDIKAALEEFDDGVDDYNNDEVLVREEAKRAKFKDSDDFFEEAPKKTMGIISGKEIQDAEEYDVIGEMERRAGEVEREPEPKGEKVTATLKKAGGGVKSFFTHCGYFVTNVKREIKRKKAAKKRQQYEEDRKRRARERAERQRRQAENGGLVQVHKRTDRKPPQQRRPASQQRRPANPQNRKNNPPRRR